MALPDRNFIKVLLSIALIGAFIWAFSFKHAAMLKESYKKGFDDAVGSISTSLTAAQKQTDGYAAQVSQLQNDLGKANGNLIQLQRELDKARRSLDLVSRQKDHITQSLKQRQESFSGKVSAIKQAYERKIQALLRRPKIKKMDELASQIQQLQADLEQSQAKSASLQEQVNGLKQQLAAAANDQQSANTAQNLQGLLPTHRNW